ncbi:MAG: GatB/YqeY domain-containing protein [Desulfotalea sp.]
MSMQDDLKASLKPAMKAKDKDRVGAIRILIGEFQRQPEKELSDEQVIGIVKKLIKSERELLAAAKEETSGYLVVMESFMPKQASEEEVKDWVVANINFSEFGNKMQAMRPIMDHFGSSVDGNVVKKILQEL